MKMNKKKLAVVSLVLCIAAIISMGSLAWFTAEDTVENTLKFSTDFAMDLIEHKGEKVVGKGDNPTGLTFKGLKPGDSIDKDPTVINKSKNEAQWIKFTVSFDNAGTWSALVADFTTIFTGYDSSLWTVVDDPKVEDSKYVATFYLTEKLAAGAEQALFTGITIPETMTLEQAQAVSTTKLTVTADAMQAEAGEDVLEAFGVSAG